MFCFVFVLTTPSVSVCPKFSYMYLLLWNPIYVVISFGVGIINLQTTYSTYTSCYKYGDSTSRTPKDFVVQERTLFVKYFGFFS